MARGCGGGEFSCLPRKKKLIEGYVTVLPIYDSKKLTREKR